MRHQDISTDDIGYVGYDILLSHTGKDANNLCHVSVDNYSNWNYIFMISEWNLARQMLIRRQPNAPYTDPVLPNSIGIMGHYAFHHDVNDICSKRYTACM